MNQFEITILDYIQAHFRSDFGDAVIPVFTHLGDGGWVCIAFTLLLIAIPKTRKVGIAVFVSLLLEALLCNVTLKPLVARTRPYDFNTAVTPLIGKQVDYSFPSGHTGSTFAVASGLFFKKNKLWIPFTIFAVLIGFSRMYVYVHYPSDVLVGALMGILSGFVAVKLLESKLFQRKKDNI